MFPTGGSSRHYRQWREHGEVELVAAVVDQARLDIEDGLKPTKSKDVKFKRRLYFERAWAWLKQPPYEPLDPWSFAWCCQVLDMHQNELVRKIISDHDNARRKQRRGRCRKRS